MEDGTEIEKQVVPDELSMFASVIEATPDIKPVVEEIKPKAEIESPLIEKPIATENKEHLNTDDNSFKTLFPEYNSPDEIKTKIKERGEFETKVKDYEARVQELEKDLQFHKDQVPFNDENLFRLDQIKKTNPEDYDLCSKLVFGGHTPLEILKIKFLKDNPTFKDKKPELIENIIMKPYRVTSVEGDDDYEMEVELSHAEMQKAAESAKKELLKPFDAIQLPPRKSAEDIKKEQLDASEKVISGWRPKFRGVVEGFFRTQEPIVSFKNKAGEVIFEVKPDFSGNVDEDIKLYGEMASSQITGNGIPYSEEAENGIRSFMKNLYVIKNIDKIIEASTEAAEERARIKYSNPGVVHNKDKKETPDSEKEKAEMNETISAIRKL